MFGYIVVNQPELKFREFDVYKSYYCGLCRDLKKNYGAFGQMTLSYDTTFLVLLLTGLYEPEETAGVTRCIAHPFEKHATISNPYSDYAAQINTILSYWSCIDDWNDERKYKKLFFAKLLEGGAKKTADELKEKTEIIIDSLKRLSEFEKNPAKDFDTALDNVSGCFGQIMAEVLAYKHDEWEPTLRRMGFYLGKFIYIMDAWDDLDKDRNTGSYNPLIPIADQMGYSVNASSTDHVPDQFYEYVKQLLTMMMAECCKCFETLPIIKNAELLRNILYSGVWARWNSKTAGKEDNGSNAVADE